MIEDYSTSLKQDAEEIPDVPETLSESTPPINWDQIWERLVRLGLGEIAIRVGTGLSSLVLVLLAIWVMGNFYLKGQVTDKNSSAQAAPLPTETPVVQAAIFKPLPASAFSSGIARLTVIHTTIPTRPRFDITEYTVENGDTIFWIAQKFDLKPETLLFGNYDILADNAESLRPGQKLRILPVDGVYYQWHAGDGLNGVAKFYGVSPDEIIEWPGNHLSKDSVGDLTSPNIKPGTGIVIPGGHRDFVSWSAPAISRKDPAVAKILGPGACGPVNDGPIGTGKFIWPTVLKYLSGFDYDPSINHYGIDIAATMGSPIFAADSGVVVYAGWNNWGYGNMIVVDHGNGWQSLYAHLSSLNVGCGSYVNQGATIAAAGATGNAEGPHLHFELRSNYYDRVNPSDFLPK
ncbi:MAG: M23 family metallopeptidase [Anaerolineaceae bacterium]|nr:M23 family metallopeptidase [Anaerolineaceae bacterium]